MVLACPSAVGRQDFLLRLVCVLGRQGLPTAETRRFSAKPCLQSFVVFFGAMPEKIRFFGYGAVRGGVVSVGVVASFSAPPLSYSCALVGALRVFAVPLSCGALFEKYCFLERSTMQEMNYFTILELAYFSEE